MPRMTKAQTAKLAKLRACSDAARNVVYAAAPDRDTKLSDCVKLASAEIVTAFQDACDHVTAFEHQLIAEGRGYRNSYGAFQPH